MPLAFKFQFPLMPTLNISAAIKRTIITFSLKHNQHYSKYMD
uniref:Uncharacterized protein n=1 Tax=Anguilla anguilla TaxID=7936 RepID=A0A0E9T5C3_ANGAN